MALCDESATTVPERRLVPIERDFAQKLQFWARKLHLGARSSLFGFGTLLAAPDANQCGRAVRWMTRSQKWRPAQTTRCASSYRARDAPGGSWVSPSVHSDCVS